MENINKTKNNTNTANNSLGQRLKYLRKLRHLSQEAVAQQIGIMRCTYYHYEAGRTIPPAKTLYALADLYGLSPDLLLYPDSGDDAMKEPSFVKNNNLTDKELELIYYYRNMDLRAQDDILMFAKLKGEKV